MLNVQQNIQQQKFNDQILQEIILKKYSQVRDLQINGSNFYPSEITNNLITLPPGYHLFNINNIAQRQSPRDKVYYFQETQEDNSKVFFTMSVISDVKMQVNQDIKILTTNKYIIVHETYDPMVITYDSQERKWEKFSKLKWEIYNYDIQFMIDYIKKPLANKIENLQINNSALNNILIRKMEDLEHKQQLHKKLLTALIALILLLLICVIYIVYINYYKNPKTIYRDIKLYTNKKDKNNNTNNDNDDNNDNDIDNN